MRSCCGWSPDIFRPPVPSCRPRGPALAGWACAASRWVRARRAPLFGRALGRRTPAEKRAARGCRARRRAASWPARRRDSIAALHCGGKAAGRGVDAQEACASDRMRLPARMRVRRVSSRARSGAPLGGNACAACEPTHVQRRWCCIASARRPGPCSESAESSGISCSAAARRRPAAAARLALARVGAGRRWESGGGWGKFT